MKVVFLNFLMVGLMVIASSTREISFTVMASYSLERANYVIYFARKSTSNLDSLLTYIQFCEFKILISYPVTPK
jgi:hypothetical protein